MFKDKKKKWKTATTHMEDLEFVFSFLLIFSKNSNNTFIFFKIYLKI